MKLYQSLSGIKLLSNYTSKFMFVAFLGIHIPLFGVIGLLIYSSGSTIDKVSCFLLTLGLTLLATVVTLVILNGLVLPIKSAQRSLSDYLDKQAMPNLPTDMTDEVGILMRDINTVVAALHNCINEKNKVIDALSTDLRIPAENILDTVQLIKNEKDADKVAYYLKSIETTLNVQLKLIDGIVYHKVA